MKITTNVFSLPPLNVGTFSYICSSTNLSWHEKVTHNFMISDLKYLITREKGQSLLYSNHKVGSCAFFITRVPLSSSCGTRQSGPPKWRSADWLRASRKTNRKFEWVFVCTQQSRLLLVGRDTIRLIDYINCQQRSLKLLIMIKTFRFLGFSEKQHKTVQGY